MKWQYVVHIAPYNGILMNIAGGDRVSKIEYEFGQKSARQASTQADGQYHCKRTHIYGANLAIFCCFANSAPDWLSCCESGLCDYFARCGTAANTPRLANSINANTKIQLNWYFVGQTYRSRIDKYWNDSYAEPNTNISSELSWKLAVPSVLKWAKERTWRTTSAWMLKLVLWIFIYWAKCRRTRKRGDHKNGMYIFGLSFRSMCELDNFIWWTQAAYVCCALNSSKKRKERKAHRHAIRKTSVTASIPMDDAAYTFTHIFIYLPSRCCWSRVNGEG